MKLVSLSDIKPSTYNPRLADPKRLDVIELSLRKLGFLLPLYADDNGEILSGHQRHFVATRMGLKRVPVEFCPPMDLNERKALNIAFNRGTNDLQQRDTPASLTDALSSYNVFEIAKALPDLDQASDLFYRCMHLQKLSIDPFLKVNSGRWVNYARNMASMLAKKGIMMPIVATSDYVVINGIGRLQHLAERSKTHIEAVFISDKEAELTNAMLNYLSMDFDIHNRYKDMLRYNSFRRARRVRRGLGRGFVFAIIGNKAAADFDVTETESKKRWIHHYGQSVLDFGAGHLTETELLRSIGVRVTPFEPYRLGENEEIDKAESFRVVNEFIKDVQAGIPYSSVFISSVLNSVPFKEDREHIVCICAALCAKHTRLFAVASSRSHADWHSRNGRHMLSSTRGREKAFILDYEPGITIGDFSDKPKVQKYHSQQEFYELFKQFFSVVNITEDSVGVRAICAQVKEVDPARLQKAIEFEFNLPYPDGTRMDMVDNALNVFSKRLKIRL